jgi:hypothetical protein
LFLDKSRYLLNELFACVQRVRLICLKSIIWKIEQLILKV